MRPQSCRPAKTHPDPVKKKLFQTLLRSHSGEERLWKVWWLRGVPVAWATSALVIGAEDLRVAGHHVAGDWLDVLRLLLYVAWARLAWQCAGNVDARLWTPASRALLSAGLVVMMFL